MEYKEWLKQVNRLVFLKTGLSTEDLPDFDYWTSWDANESPEDCVYNAIQWWRTY